MTQWIAVALTLFLAIAIQHYAARPSYSCAGDFYNCENFSSRQALMDYWNACPGDPSGLDRDVDGLPCERE